MTRAQVTLVLMLGACSAPLPSIPDAAVNLDAGPATDAGLDAGGGAGTDAGADAGAGADGGHDAGTGGADAGVDGGIDAGVGCRRARLDLVKLSGISGPLGPRALTVRDLSRDGRPELLVLLKEPGRLMVLDGLADAGYQARPLLDVGQTPNDLAAVDLDGDGFDELLVVGHFTDALYVWAGSPGGWSTRTVYPLGNHCQRLRLIDLDGDGHLDAVTQNGGSAGYFTFTFLRGLPDGGFAPAVPHLVSDAPSDLEVLPSGLVLVATVNTPGVERWSFGADGTFRPLPPWTLPGRALRLTLADLTGDGQPELLAALGLESPGFVSVHALEPDGGLLPVGRLDVDRAYEALPLDLDEDGQLEVAVSSLSGELVLFHRTADGGFASQKGVFDGGWPTSTVAADLDVDGRPDLAWTTIDGWLELAFDVATCAR